MSNRDDGGPAFPVNYDHQIFNPETVSESKRLMSGLSLRDYFAAKAMQGVMSSMDSAQYNYTSEEKIAEDAYAIADAMLKERTK